MANHYPLIGAHVSAAGGLWKAFQNAEAIGAEAIQIFGASPRGWAWKLPDVETIKKFKEAYTKSGVKAVYLHGAYLVNLASPNPEMVKKSIENLAGHLAITEAIGANGLIFHVGSGNGEMPKDKAMAQAVKAIQQVLKQVPGKAELVIENAAGGGDKLGANPEDIGSMLRAIGSGRMKVCIDTAHSFEAGSIEKYEPKQLKEFLDRWDKEVGIKNVVALHANDSKTAFNSRHDRHENIGEGFIGLQGFKNLGK
jgi:deoxyribonuclease-4